MTRFVSFGRAMSHSAAELLSLLSILSQFFGAFNALKLNWIRVAVDLRPSAAGLSTLISIGGFAVGWYTGGVLGEQKSTHKVGSLLWRAVFGMIVSYLVYWVLNVAYTTGSKSDLIDIALRFFFLLFYAMPFGFLSYLCGLLTVAGSAADH